MNNYIYIAVMALVSYAIRILPLTLIRKPIKNRFIQSFLYYVPYVTLAVMTFPAIIRATQTPISGAAALAAGIIAAWCGAGLFPVSSSAARWCLSLSCLCKPNQQQERLLFNTRCLPHRGRFFVLCRMHKIQP